MPTPLDPNEKIHTIEIVNVTRYKLIFSFSFFVFRKIKNRAERLNAWEMGLPARENARYNSEFWPASSIVKEIINMVKLNKIKFLPISNSFLYKVPLIKGIIEKKKKNEAFVMKIVNVEGVLYRDKSNDNKMAKKYMKIISTNTFTGNSCSLYNQMKNRIDAIKKVKKEKFSKYKLVILKNDKRLIFPTRKNQAKTLLIEIFI